MCGADRHHNLHRRSVRIEDLEHSPVDLSHLQGGQSTFRRAGQGGGISGSLGLRLLAHLVSNVDHQQDSHQPHPQQEHNQRQGLATIT